jgi:putative nucleotidyltransferase with HDIG domain
LSEVLDAREGRRQDVFFHRRLQDCEQLPGAGMSRIVLTPVESGSYVVSKARSETLFAPLGTCVGVAIVDRLARVGGLYHILLPDPPSRGAPYPAGTYAQTGLPLFIQELVEAGAAPERMEATLAGGALVGVISRFDLELDIGGRTVEVANRILGAFGVPVVRSETGGVYGSRLRLDLHTLECRIEPILAAGVARQEAAHHLTDEDISRAIASVKPIPQLALRIIRSIQSEDYGLRDIAKQIRHDQVISARVMRFCNSAYLAGQERVRSIDRALMLLGEKAVLRAILSSALEGFFGGSNRGYSLSKGGAYHHAVSAGIVSAHVSRLTGSGDQDVAYTAGLLHDIGKVLLDQHIAAASALFYGRVMSSGEALQDIETALLGITHCEAGARLAEAWSFSPSLKDAIAYHNEPERARHDPLLTHVVHLADLLVSRFDVGHDLERLPTEGLEGRLRQLGLNSRSLPELIAEIPWNSVSKSGGF